MENSKNFKSWSQMTKEEKQNSMKDIAKLRGYAKSWEEIGEYYSAKSSTVRTAFSDFSKSEKNEEKSCSQILKESTTQIDESLLLQVLSRLESLELELATVKKLQVERASIEKLDDTEFNYFVSKFGREIGKFNNLKECAEFIKENGVDIDVRALIGFLERGLKTKESVCFNSSGIRVEQSFKSNTERLNSENEIRKLQVQELTQKFEDISKELL